MSSNGANEVTRSAKEECKKEERQVLSVADKQTDSLCVDERWSRGESSDCPDANCSQLSVGFRFDCDCDDERWSRGESLCDNERWSRGESSVCPGVNSVGVCSDCDHRRTTNSVMEHERTKPTACGTSSNISKDATLFPVTHRLLNKAKTCVMHVKKTWEPARQADAVSRAASGKAPIASRTFALGLQSTTEICPAYMVCQRCGSAVCVVCAKALARKLDTFKDQDGTPYSKALHQLLDATLPEGAPPSSTILLELPGIFSHCCELKLRALEVKQESSIKQPPNKLILATQKRRRKKRKRKNQSMNVSLASKTRKEMDKQNVPLISKLPDPTWPSMNMHEKKSINSPVDGIFGAVGFDVAIYPSLKYPDTLSLAQIGDSKSLSLVQGVFHSVIPNRLALQYQHDNVAPEGSLTDVAKFDRTEYITVVCPLDGRCMKVKVRMIGIRRSQVDHETPPGACHFENCDVFRRCVPLFDHRMEQEDINNNIDVSMVFGAASENDIGTSMHNLTSRFYRKEWSIPQFDDVELALLSEQLFSSLTKNGFETMRRGGSSGIAVPDDDFFSYFKKHRGSTPRLTSSVKFLRRNNRTWQMLYVTPYKGSPTLACPPSMGPPRRGGQIRITHKNIVGYKELFKRFVYVRALTGCLLQVINKLYHYSVVPGAVINQMAQNE